MFYCLKCKQEVAPVTGTFRHPHLGEQTCWLCPLCKVPVTWKEEKDGQSKGIPVDA